MVSAENICCSKQLHLLDCGSNGPFQFEQAKKKGAGILLYYSSKKCCTSAKPQGLVF